jgi:hypothetical protein
MFFFWQITYMKYDMNTFLTGEYMCKCMYVPNVNRYLTCMRMYVCHGCGNICMHDSFFRHVPMCICECVCAGIHVSMHICMYRKC